MVKSLWSMAEEHTASLQSFPSSGEEATFSITWRALLRYPGCHSRGMLWYTARSPCCTSTFPVAKRNNEAAQPWLPTMPETEALKAQASMLHLAAGGTGKDHFKLVPRASFQPVTLQMDEEMVKFIVYIFKYKIAKTCFSSFLFGLMFWGCMNHRAEENLERLMYLSLSGATLIKQVRQLKYYFCFKNKSAQKKKFHNFPTVKILSTSDNALCQEMFDIFWNALKHPIDCPYGKKEFFILLFFPLFEHQHLKSSSPHHPFGWQEMNVSFGSSTHHAGPWDVDAR